MSQLNVDNVTASSVNAGGIITAANGMKLPTFTSASRPSNIDTGVVIFNSDNTDVEVWSGSAWSGLSSSALRTWTTSTRPGSGLVAGLIGWNQSTESLEIYNGSTWVALTPQTGFAGDSESNPAASAQAIFEANPAATDGYYYIDTPNGGVQRIYCIFDAAVSNRGWMVVGKFAADASDTVASTISTSRGETVDNASGTIFSADFGDGNYDFQRFIGTNDITAWSNTRNLDWYWGIPSGRPWKRFWTNGNSSGFTNVRRYGFTVNGAFDGRGRWTNTGFNFYQVSDTNESIAEGAFTNPGSFNIHSSGSDGKFGVISSGSTTGQDESVEVQFGYDDGRRAFMDIYPSTEGNNTNRRDYSTAVFCLLS